MDGWKEEALRARKLREKENEAMRAFSSLVEQWVKGELDEPTMLLAFHHVAMAHGSGAGKKTLQKALKSSIEKVSQLAPSIYPPDRVVTFKPKKKRGHNEPKSSDRDGAERPSDHPGHKSV